MINLIDKKLVLHQPVQGRKPLNKFFRDVFGTPLKATKTLDETPSEEALDFLGEYKKKFPALFAVYYGGPDHYAHDIGMDGGASNSSENYTGYKDYFKKKTDVEIKKVIDKLKALDEFDNKIFIVTSDHGHTAMPDAVPTKLYEATPDERTVTPDVACELKLTGFGKKGKSEDAELANNNLHIWELGEVMKAVGSIQNTVVRNKYKLLVPSEIEQIFVNESVPIEYRPTSATNTADVIAALNGPMAHIYSMIGTDNKTLGEIAEVFRVMLGGLYSGEATKWLGFANREEYFKFKKQSVGRLAKAIDKILIRLEDDHYSIFDGLDSNGNPLTTDISDLPSQSYVEAMTRINGMNNKDRSGDIVLLMKYDTDIPQNEKIEDHRYTTGVSCKSWHGSLNPSDSYVPFIFAYPGGNKNEIEQVVKKDTLCKQDYSGCKGNWSLTDIVKEIILQQY